MFNMFDMMSTAALPLTLFALGVAALLIISRTVLAGWRDWIALKRDELASAAAIQQPSYSSGGEAALSAMERIELADMRERLRKLEAIAAGVDL